MENNRKDFAFDRINFILLAVGMVIVVVGFILMSGPGSTETSFNADIFSARRIKVAPMVCLFGFLSMIYAIIRKPSDKKSIDAPESSDDSTIKE